MNPPCRDWLAGLKRFSEEHRSARPPRVAPMPSETAWPAPQHTSQQRIVLDHLLIWKTTVLAEAAAADPPVALVLTTTAPNLSGVSRALADLDSDFRARLVVATELEYRLWCLRPPDDYRLHTNLWTWVKAPLPAQRRAEFGRFPIPPSDAYWLHRYGFIDKTTERRFADLWRWDGSQATLLATGLVEGVSRL